MLKIQILGKGLIPRLGVLAPITEPTPVTKDTIQLIFSSPNLRMNYYNEVTNNFHPLTKSNYQKIWNDYSVVRTANGTKKAANPKADTTPGFTQETAMNEVEDETSRKRPNPPVRNNQPAVPVQTPPPVVNDQVEVKTDLDNLAPDTAAPVTDVKVEEKKDQSKPEEKVNVEEPKVEEKVEEKTESTETPSNSGFAPIGKEDRNKNNNGKKNK